ncbi:MAG TPA: L-threonylcarbamoyladenylate synthase [Candidatus Paceibacterota bacterium]|nr:L-threonylcarbamoyladenylate synthase [Candidatus Paceibacterota bacterium]
MKDIALQLKSGKIGVMATDTIYGVVAQALDKKAVEKVYTAKGRDMAKGVLVLISSLNDLKQFCVVAGAQDLKALKKYWPGKVTVVLPIKKSSLKRWKHIHRGNNTIAFRLPKKKSLISLLKKTGPLIAPSANPQGLAPARTIAEARKYFEDKVDFYASGPVSKKPSKIIALEEGRVTVIRN